MEEDRGWLHQIRGRLLTWEAKVVCFLKIDEDWMKLFWTILKSLPLEWSLHWWRKGDLMIFMLIKA